MGHRIDYEIAIKVMGWKEIWPKPSPGDHFSAAGDKWRYGFIKSRWPNGCEIDEWNPSSNISHAFEVVSKMQRDGYMVNIADYIGDHDWHCSFARDMKEFNGKAKSLEMAICKAALRIVNGRCTRPRDNSE